MSIVVPPQHRVRMASNWLAVVDQRNKEVLVEDSEPFVFTCASVAHEALAYCREQWPGRVFALQVIAPIMYPVEVRVTGEEHAVVD